MIIQIDPASIANMASHEDLEKLIRECQRQLTYRQNYGRKHQPHEWETEIDYIRRQKELFPDNSLQFYKSAYEMSKFDPIKE